jgi:hypothetical protein
MATHQYQEGKYIRRVDFDSEGRVARYTINFYRLDHGADWYDEIRYDSHEIGKGKDTAAPHFHMKLRSAFKDDADAAVEEIQFIINNQVKQITGVLEK